MNKKTSIFLGLFAITLMSIGVIAFSNAYMNNGNNNAANYNEDRHALMEKAFETNDYNLWKSQMTGKGALSKINEGNFAKFAEAHRLTNEGKYDEANKIRQELGLGNRNSEGGGSCGCSGDGGTCSAEGGSGGGCGMHKNQK